MNPYYADDTVTLWHGDALDTVMGLASGSVDCVVTSPPYYGLRDYGTEGQYGLEESPAAYVETMRNLFTEIRRVLADDGTLWLNIGDSYSGSGKGAAGSEVQQRRMVEGQKDVYVPLRDHLTGRTFEGLPAKNLMGVPWRVAFALQDDGWILRNEIIWHKPNAMPESVTDRLSSRHETVFMFSKSKRYWFDLDPIREPLKHPDALDKGIRFGDTSADEYGNPTYSGNEYVRKPRKGVPEAWNAGTGLPPHQGHRGTHDEGRNPGDVWEIPTQPFGGAHFAVMPQRLASRAIQAGCKPGGTVLDPFSGSGTTGLAAAKHGRKYVGIDLNSEYLDLSLRTRLAQTALLDDLS